MREHVLALLSRYLPAGYRASGGANVLTKCPFHKGGQELKPSFSVNVEKGVFHCFTCHEAGSLQKLLKMLGVARSTIDSEMAVIKPHLDKSREKHQFNKKFAFTSNDPTKARYELPEEILGVYDHPPEPLIADGFDRDLLKRMDIGVDQANQRIMYPLRDAYGTLAGFSGGAMSKTQWPKYKVYQGRRQDLNGKWQDGDFGKWFDEQFPGYTCENHNLLWNYDSVLPQLMEMSDASDTLYVVEGFKACLWMIQSGFPSTVALMGSYISDVQQSLITRFGGTVMLCLDNDSPGQKATISVGGLLWRPMYGRVKVMPYPPGDTNTQPDDYEPEAVRQLVAAARPFATHYNEVRRREGW